MLGILEVSKLTEFCLTNLKGLRDTQISTRCSYTTEFLGRKSTLSLIRGPISTVSIFGAPAGQTVLTATEQY